MGTEPRPSVTISIKSDRLIAIIDLLEAEVIKMSNSSDPTTKKWRRLYAGMSEDLRKALLLELSDTPKRENREG